MQFTSDKHKSVYETTRDLLFSLFGEVNVQPIDDTFVLREGSTLIYVRTVPISDHIGVQVFSYVVVDVEVTPELMQYLLTYNLKLTLGAFGIEQTDAGQAAVILSHTILGNSMDREELYSSVAAVARVADDLDDGIVASFGGKTALDVLQTALPVVRWE